MYTDSIPESTTRAETESRVYERSDRPSKPYLVQRTIDWVRETESHVTAENRARQWAES